MEDLLISTSLKMGHLQSRRVLEQFKREQFGAMQPSEELRAAVLRIAVYSGDQAFIEESFQWMLDQLGAERLRYQDIQNLSYYFELAVKKAPDLIDEACFERLVEFGMQNTQTVLVYQLLCLVDDETVVKLYKVFTALPKAFEARLTRDTLWILAGTRIKCKRERLNSLKQMLEIRVLQDETDEIGLLALVNYSLRESVFDLQQLPRLMKEINQYYGYIYDYEILGIGAQAPQAPRLTLSPEYFAGITASASFVMLGDKEPLVRSIDSYFVGVLNRLYQQPEREFTRRELFLQFNEVCACAVLLAQYGSEFRFAQKLFSVFQRLQEQAYGPAGEEKPNAKAHKLFSLVPLFGSMLQENTQYKQMDFSPFFEVVQQQILQQEYAKNVGTCFGKQLTPQNIRGFIRDLIQQELIPAQYQEQIQGMTPIPQETFARKPVQSENYVLVAALGVLILENFKAMEKAQLVDQLRPGALENIVHAIIKLQKLSLQIQTRLSDEEIQTRLERFVNTHAGEVYAVAFLTDKEDYIKQFLLFRQEKITVISADQTRIALPDIYFGKLDLHTLSGLEYQFLFSQMLFSNQSITERFIQLYVDASPEQAVANLQPVLSLIFQSAHWEQYEWILRPICQSVVHRRSLCRTDSVLKTFAASLEAVNISFAVLQFQVCFISQFSSFMELCLLLVQNKLRWNNNNLQHQRFHTPLENQDGNVCILTNPDFGNLYKLTQTQTVLLLEYQHRLVTYIFRYADSFLQLIGSLGAKQVEFNINILADLLWAKRFYNPAVSSGSPEYDAEKLNYSARMKDYFQRLWEKLQPIHSRLEHHTDEFYHAAFQSNIQKIKAMCMFNQRFNTEFGQTDPRSFVIDPAAAFMLNPLFEIQEPETELLLCYQAQLDAIEKDFVLFPGNCNYYVDRLAAALLQAQIISQNDLGDLRLARLMVNRLAREGQ